MDISIHVSHQDDLVTSCLPGRDGNTKVVEEYYSRWAGITLTEEVGLMLGLETFGLGNG